MRLDGLDLSTLTHVQLLSLIEYAHAHGFTRGYYAQEVEPTLNPFYPPKYIEED